MYLCNIIIILKLHIIITEDNGPKSFKEKDLKLMKRNKCEENLDSLSFDGEGLGALVVSAGVDARVVADLLELSKDRRFSRSVVAAQNHLEAGSSRRHLVGRLRRGPRR